ncbi:MAG: AgmX/PglI C-terminal domain-containing protein [Gammaproteobacteria bacterium]|nr:AgmX/PglI C-terminal domain-containing protein [Gammaproteobacteria bacterium]
MNIVMYQYDYSLPWESGRDDTKRLRKWLLGCLLIVFVFGIAMPWLPIPEIERAELEALPPNLARIMLEKPKPVVVPPPAKQEVIEEEPEKPAPEEPVPAEVTPEPEPQVADAKEKAAISGLLAFKDAFADMRDAVDISKLQDTGAIQKGTGEAASIDRSLLTSKYGTRSAGVNVAALSTETGGVALSGRETTKVEVPVGSKGTGGVRRPRGEDARQRSIEEIRRVFDSNKGAIFAIYNRALRVDPTLQGQVVLELVIDPNGVVRDVKVVASELADEAMVAKIVNRIRLFNFGKRDVGTTTLRYPVHFLPT